MVFRLIAAAFGAAVCVHLSAAVAPRFSGAPVTRVFSEREIPGSPQTRMVAVHPSGLVYVANVEGLVEYDGVTWQMVPGTQGLIVHNVAADETGRVWYSGTGHFGWLKPDERGSLVAEPLHVRLPAEARNVGHVLRLLTHGSEAYFVTQGPRGFVVHADDAGRVRVIEAPAGERPVTLFARAEAVHVITTANCYRIDGDRLVPVRGGAALAQSDVHSVWPGETADTSWVVSAAGLRRWAGGEAPLTSTAVSTLLEGDRVSCGAPLGDGTFVLGTERHGLLLVEAASGRMLARYDGDGGMGAASSTIVAATPDDEGGVWLARFAGVTRVQLRSPMARHDGVGGVRGRVQAFVHHRNRVHVATTQGVFVRDPARGQFLPLEQAPGDSWVLLSTGEGLIVGGPDLRLVRDDGSVEWIERERLLFRSAVRLRRDPDCLVACTGPGLVRIYRRVEGRWTFEGQLARVRASLYPIFEDDAGYLWATRNRLEVVRIDWREGVRLDAELEPLGVGHGLPDPAVDRARVMVFPVDGAAEVASASGLWRHDRAADRFMPETRIAGREPARWSRAWPLSDGSLWLANTREGDSGGIARRVGPDSWQFTPQAYTGVEAIRPLEVIDDPHSATVWIGHLGLASVDLKATSVRAGPPRVRLRQIASTGNTLLWGGAGEPRLGELPPEQNALYVSFAAPTFQPDAYGDTRIEYRARLEGLEGDWSPWSTASRRDYPGLPPRHFTLHVQARDGAGREGPVVALPFRVLPPWWRTGWFLSLAAGGGVAVVAGATRWQMSRVMRRRLALLEAQSAVERERLRLARDLHDEVGSGLGRVILFAHEARRHAEDPARLRPELERVQASAQELMQHAREIVWAVSPQHDTLRSVVERIADYVEQTFAAAGIACRSELPGLDGLPVLAVAGEVRHSLFLAIKEAVHNSVKYSGAATAELRITHVADDLTLEVRDHGRGFDRGALSAPGHGLANLEARARALGGRAEILSSPGAGTQVRLIVPLQRRTK
jgi:signal transduction histidine kinase